MTVIDEQKQDNVKITLTIPRKLEGLIDSYAHKNFIKKTQWIVQAITEKIGKELEKEEVMNKNNYK